MRKPPRAREGLALALPRSSSLAQNLCCSPCREKQFAHSPIQTFTVTRCTKWRAEQWIFHVSHHLETKHLSVCRAQFCTAFLPPLENIMYASHLAASLQYPCHRMKLPPLNNVLNTKEHKPSYIRKCGLLQTSSATKPKFFFAINRFDKKTHLLCYLSEGLNCRYSFLSDCASAHNWKLFIFLCPCFSTIQRSLHLLDSRAHLLKPRSEPRMLAICQSLRQTLWFQRRKFSQALFLKQISKAGSKPSVLRNYYCHMKDFTKWNRVCLWVSSPLLFYCRYLSENKMFCPWKIIYSSMCSPTKISVVSVSYAELGGLMKDIRKK